MAARTDGEDIGFIAADGEQWTPLRVLVIGLCFLLNMLDGTDISIMSFVAPVLSAQWTVSAERLGVLFSAGLAGMALGCLGVAPLADRYGRRSLIVASLAVTSTAMLSSALVHSIGELMWARLFIGVGVGTIGVTMTTMAAEYAPSRHASFAVGFVQAGWPFASILCGFAAASILPAHGWHSMLLGIGLLSAALLVLILAVLPESLSFLTLRRPPNALAKINALRRRLKLPDLAHLPPAAEQPPRVRIAALFARQRRWPSALLWAAVTLGYFVLYFVISWIPKLATQAGLPLAQAIYAGATYNLGAFIGTAAVGWLAGKYGLNRVIGAYLATAAVVMIIFGGVAMPVGLTLLTALCVGVTVQGGFNGFWALAARLYPTEMRNTGVGWALGFGRIGAVLGPIAGGLLVGAHVSLPVIFALFALPPAAAAAMTFCIRVR